MKRIFAFLLGICLLFSGCFSFSEPPRSTPFSLQSGQQDFSLGTFQITEKGIEGLVSVLRDYVPLPETLGLHMINAKVNSSGELQSFDLLLEGYDNSKNSTGLYWFSYWDHQMDYIPPEQYPSPELSVAYNSNNDLQALNREFLRIPWEQQFSLLQGSDFSISYNGNRQTLEGEPLIDGRNQVDFPILTWEEYQSGQGGVGDGKTSVLFTLKDHDSQSMIFLCDPDDPSTLVQSRQPGDQTACREKDGLLQFTRDYGETWISCDLPQETVEQTLAFYQSSQPPEGTYYISPESPGILAFLYGADPNLYLSRDNGSSWQAIPIGEWDETLRGLGYGSRAVKFFNEQEGYVGIGTDFSMGLGGYKGWFSTKDGGKTWEEHSLPGGDTEILRGMSFCDPQHGVVSVRSISASYTTFFATEDGGATWTEMMVIPEDVREAEGYMYCYASSLEYTGGQYVLTISQGDQKTEFAASSLQSPWNEVPKEGTASS